MRYGLVFFLLLLGAVGHAFADDGYEARLAAIRQAADAARAAVDADDKEALAALAARDTPDPWRVCDHLCDTADFDVANAFARAAPRKDVEALPDYIGRRRADPTFGLAPDSLAKGIAAFHANENQRALELTVVDDDAATTPSVIMLLEIRGAIFSRLGDPEAADKAFAAMMARAKALGWWMMVSRALDNRTVTAIRRREWDQAVEHGTAQLALDAERGATQNLGKAHYHVGAAEEKRGRYDEALAHLQKAYDAWKAQGDDRGVLLALNTLGITKAQLGRLDAAEEHLLEALERNTASGDERGRGDNLNALAMISSRRGHYEKAIERFAATLEINVALGLDRNVASALHNLGYMHERLGDYKQSLVFYRRALEKRREMADRAGEARLLHNIGLVHQRKGEYEQAIESYTASLALSEPMGLEESMQHSYLNLGVLHADLGDLDKALAYYERAHALAVKRDVPGDIANALTNLGNIQRARGNHEAANEYFARALPLHRESGDRAAEATTLHSMGSVHYERSEYRQALARYAEALAIGESIRDQEVIVETLGAQAMVLRLLGRPYDALALYERTLEIRTEQEHEIGIARARGGIAGVASETGDLRRALTLTKALGPVYRKHGLRRDEGQNLIGLGNIYGRLGRYREARDAYAEALAIMTEIGDASLRAVCLGNIGLAHMDLGEYAIALRYQEQALEHSESLKDRGGVARALTNQGIVYLHVGEVKRAQEMYLKALAINEALGLPANIANNKVNLGLIHLRLEAFDEARALLEAALATQEELGDLAAQANTLNSLANVFMESGDLTRALEVLGRASDLAREIDDQDTLAEALCNMAICLTDLGRNEEALARAEEARAAADRTGSVNNLAWAHRALGELHLAAGRPAEAVADARSAVSVLPRMLAGHAERHSAGVREVWAPVYDLGIEAALALNDPEELTYFLESGRAGALLEALGGRSALDEDMLPKALLDAEAEARLDEASAHAAYLRARKTGKRGPIRETRNAWDAARARVEEAIDAIQREAKNAAQVLYPEAASLARIQSTLRAGEALVIYALLPDAACALVVTPKRARIVRLPPMEEIEALCETLTGDGWHEMKEECVVALRRAVVDPLGLEEATTRLLVSPAGVLASIPLSVLAPGRDVVFVPSGTTLVWLRGLRDPAGKRILALGAPDYTGRDLASLPATSNEARSIGDVVLLGDEASESGLRAALEKEPRWAAVHLACHGLIDLERPQRSALALTRADPDDGLLTAHEVFRMRVPADLVVLSACETGRGRIFRAEGMFGLTRAFMFAGSPSVVCSLWKVDDAATAALMSRFYRALGEGAGPAGALESAKASVRSEEEWAHPYYWAAWVLWGLPD